MNRKPCRLHKFLLAAFFTPAIFCCGSRAFALPPGDSIVRFDTTLGSFDVELFNSTAPITVANFLNYVSSGRYVDTLVHRSVPGFVIQGGGYSFSPTSQGAFQDPLDHIVPVPAFPPIANETLLHNVRGTLAMARTFDPNSATNQWFINLVDNSANLDVQSGGFAVFGQILGQGMNVVDAIAALPRLNVLSASPFSEVPYVSLPTGSLAKENLVIVNNIRVVPEPASAVLIGMAALCGVAGRILTRSIRQAHAGGAGTQRGNVSYVVTWRLGCRIGDSRSKVKVEEHRWASEQWHTALLLVGQERRETGLSEMVIAGKSFLDFVLLHDKEADTVRQGPGLIRSFAK